MPVLGRNLRERLTRVTAAGAVVGGALAAWSLYEAQWVETLEVDVLVPGLHEDLRGFRILHLSDFHLGTFSLNGRALRKAVDWGREQHPDLVAVTGDLVSRRRGAPELHRVLNALAAPYGVHVVLGNHDLGRTRDPFNQPGDPAEVESAGAVLHAGSAGTLEVGSARLQVVGVDPVSFRRRVRPGALVDPEADLRILLCHFPDVVRWLEPDDFDLTLAGHLHGGQICIPTPGGKLRLEHLRALHWEGLHQTAAGQLYVSRGLGTSFVPFRFLARPEVTLLRLKRAH
jgi:predicted MPP superfamily phosphohydrolase